MKLYEITEKLETLDRMYMDLVDEETGEFKESTEELDKVNELLLEELQNKSEGIIKYLQSEKSDIKAIEDEIKRLQSLKKSKEKKLDWFKHYVEINMMKLGTKSIKTTLGTISLRKSTKTIVMEEIISKDPRYWSTVTEDKFDKKVIKSLLESGEVINGAVLETNFSVNVK